MNIFAQYTTSSEDEETSSDSPVHFITLNGGDSSDEEIHQDQNQLQQRYSSNQNEATDDNNL